MAKLEEFDLTTLEGKAFVIGRGGHIFIDDETVSRKHAEISIRDGKIYLRDLHSKNGTYLVRNNKLVMFEQGVVSPLQTLMIGDRKCQVAELLRIAGHFIDGDDATTVVKPPRGGRKASQR